MKKKTILLTVIGVLVAALTVGGIVAISSNRPSDEPADIVETSDKPETVSPSPIISDVTTHEDETSDDPVIPNDTTPADETDEEDVPVETEPVTNKPEDPGVVIVEPKAPENGIPVVTGKAEEPIKPVVTDRGEVKKDPEPTGKIVIGGGDPEHEVYDCKTANHHCDGPETHAFISNLELKGCPYCGSHNCKSFYAVDAWGHTSYDPGRCPMFNVHSDPMHYCKTCGKKVGDGTNGTCVTFNVDIVCPLCKASVKAWECHTCK